MPASASREINITVYDIKKMRLTVFTERRGLIQKSSAGIEAH